MVANALLLIESPHMPVRLHPILSCSAPPPAPDVPEELWIHKSTQLVEKKHQGLEGML